MVLDTGANSSSYQSYQTQVQIPLGTMWKHELIFMNINIEGRSKGSKAEPYPPIRSAKLGTLNVPLLASTFRNMQCNGGSREDITLCHVTGLSLCFNSGYAY